ELGRTPRALSLREGSALPLCSSATGRTFLAYLPKTQTRDLLRSERALRHDAGRSWSDQELEAEFAVIRAKRVYWTSDAIIPSTLMIAPVLDTRQELHAVLAVLPRHDQRSPADLEHLRSALATKLAHLALDLT